LWGFVSDFDWGISSYVLPVLVFRSACLSPTFAVNGSLRRTCNLMPFGIGILIVAASTTQRDKNI
jgi:hypothetical protein